MDTRLSGRVRRARPSSSAVRPGYSVILFGSSRHQPRTFGAGEAVKAMRWAERQIAAGNAHGYDMSNADSASAPKGGR